MTEAAPAPRRRLAVWGSAGAVGAAAFLAFARALPGAFVFDDERFIVANPHVQHPESWLRLLTDATTVDPISPGGIVRPLRTVEFALDRALFGVDSFAFHLHSLLWYTLAAVLLLFVLRRLLGDGRAALLGALFWAVHPVQTEAAAFISSRGDVAMAACTFAAVLFALRSRGFDRWLSLSLTAAAVGMLYKEAGVVVFIVVAVLRWTRLARAPVWPYLALGLVYWFGYRGLVQVGPTSHGVTFVLGGSAAGTFATMFRAFGFYLAQVLLPAQSLDWYLTSSTTLADPVALAWLAVHLAIVVSAVRARTTSPAWTLAVAWFYAFLLPVANWPVSLGIPTAERFLHVPLAGAALALSWAIVRAPRARWPAAVVVAALFAGSVARCGLWLDDDRLWLGARADHPSPRAAAWVGQTARADGLAIRNRAATMPAGDARDAAKAREVALLEESLAAYHEALSLWYGFERSSRSLGQFARHVETYTSNVCYLLGRNEEALFHADEALLIPGPAVPELHYYRAWALLGLGFGPQAIDSMRTARELGYGGTDPELGRFFLRAARLCERDGLLSAAGAGYRLAEDASPEGPVRAEAQSAADALLRRPTAPDAAAERARIAELDARLANLPRACPAPRGPTDSK
jgi:hypothetical protein